MRLITVVVDATFGHRIDSKEVAEFDAAVSNNEIVAPPAGAIGRGDAFVLSIANKVNATILSNDSYQEFHGTHTWLFDEGRLVGGKPVPHIGWVFVNRLPVRGPTSRKSVSEAKRGRSPKIKAASPEASQPMPDPRLAAAAARPCRSPAVAATRQAGRSRGEAADEAATRAEAADSRPRIACRTDTEKHRYERPACVPDLRRTSHARQQRQRDRRELLSHGAYVRIGDVKGYVPLSLMSDPAPRSAREFMKIGESITLGRRELRARADAASIWRSRRWPRSRCRRPTHRSRRSRSVPGRQRPRRRRHASVDDANGARRGQVDAQTRRQPRRRRSGHRRRRQQPRHRPTAAAAKPRAANSVLQPRHRRLLRHHRRPAKKARSPQGSVAGNLGDATERAEPSRQADSTPYQGGIVRYGRLLCGSPRGTSTR